jgi:hypothetical protein
LVESGKRFASATDESLLVAMLDRLLEPIE